MRRIQVFGAVLCALFSLFLIFGCQTAEQITISSVSIKSSTVGNAIDVSDFDLTDLVLAVTFSDGSSEEIAVTETMIASADLSKLDFMGTHEITLTYLGFEVPVTIELTDAATTSLLQAYFDYNVNTLGFLGTYQEWLNTVSNNPTVTVIRATQNQIGEIILTLSNMETINLGVMNQITYTVEFYGFDGTLVSSVTVTPGGSAVPPTLSPVQDYQFMGWSLDFNAVTSDMKIYAMYEYIDVPIDSIEDADELLISIQRLEEAQFEVDLNAIFKTVSNTQSVKTSRSLSSILSMGTTLDVDDPYAIEDYVPHTYWTDYYYHKGLYQQPEVIDGFHVITSTLTAYNDHALNNLYEVTDIVTSQARERADWAVDNLTVMDTWVSREHTKYLLHYDETLDRVELYTIWVYAPYFVTSYEKIYVYYNARGEEVVESWVYQVYSEGDYPGVMAYHNSVAGRDFNYYAIWLDENREPSNQYHFRGINLNDEGYYEYYDNNLHMVSGDYGWYTIQPRLDLEEETISYPEEPAIAMYSPNARTNVMFIWPSAGEDIYQVDVYLPSMNGIEAILVEEGGMFQTNQDSLDTQQMLINEGFELMPDWWASAWAPEIDFGIRTVNGTYFADNIWSEDPVVFTYLHLNIGRSGLMEYQRYHNYYGVASFRVRGDSISTAVHHLADYLEGMGITYKFGNMDLLFDELAYVYENYEIIGRRVNVTNDGMDGPKDMYTTFEHYTDVHAYLTDYLNIYEALVQMETDHEVITFEALPDKADLDRITLIETSTAIVGGLALVELKLSTDQITATLNRSPLLQQDQSYSLIYGLRLGGRLIVLGHETPQIFSGNTLTFQGDLTLDIPTDLPYGDYQLVTFFAKLVDEGFLRISNVMPCPVSTFDAFETIHLFEETEDATKTVISPYEDSLIIQSSFTDGFGPKVLFDGDDTLYRHGDVVEEIYLPYGSTVSEFLDLIQIVDNVDGPIVPALTMMMQDGQPVLAGDLVTPLGWHLMISDQAGNVTTLDITLVSYLYYVTIIVDVTVDEVLVKADETVELPISPTKIGHTFVGWNTENFVITENRTIEAIFEAKQYAINYHLLDQPRGKEILIDAGDHIIQVSNGALHSAVLTSKGSLFTWGYNNKGQLGRESNESTNLMPMDIQSRFYLIGEERIIDIASGKEHMLALTSYGRLFAWGHNVFGYLGMGEYSSIPVDVTSQYPLSDQETIVSISSGSYHAGLLTSQGRLIMFGMNAQGQLGNGTTTNTGVPYADITERLGLLPNESISHMSFGAMHSALITSFGRLFMWGYNNFGQLGVNNSTISDLPIDITSRIPLMTDEDISHVSLGDYHSGIITSTGRVFTWGRNDAGQLGDGSTTLTSTPVDITNQFAFDTDELPLQLFFGSLNSALITTQGHVYVWGSNTYGHMGDDTGANRLTPFHLTQGMTFAEEEQIIQMSHGDVMSAAMARNGQLFVWGFNTYGQIGDTGVSGFNAPDAYDIHETVFMDQDLYPYGSETQAYTPSKLGYQFIGWYANLLTYESYVFSTMPARDITIYGRWSIDLYRIFFYTNGGQTTMVNGMFYTVEDSIILEEATKEGYNFLGWYDNPEFSGDPISSIEEGTVGTLMLYAKWESLSHTITYYKLASDHPYDLPLNAGETIDHVSLGFMHSAALTSNNRLFMWGHNLDGQLGVGSTDPLSVPTEITSSLSLAPEETIIQISMGTYHSGLLTSLGRVFMWGANHSGQLGNNGSGISEIPVDITSGFDLGETEMIVQIALGGHRSMALSSLGRVFLWGVNDLGENPEGMYPNLLVPTDVTSKFNLSVDETIDQVFLGQSHGSVKTSLNRILMWGLNQWGQLGNGSIEILHRIPVDITQEFDLAVDETVTEVTLGSSFTIALTTEGRVFSWGFNNIGQLGDGTNISQNTPNEISSHFVLSETEQIIHVSAGFESAMAITNLGRVFTWGRNDYGQLGDGTQNHRDIPQEMMIDTNLVTNEHVLIGTYGGFHGMLITNIGRLLSWGGNGSGQLGHGHQNDLFVPTLHNLYLPTPWLVESYLSSEITEEPIPVGEGYTFSGWYLDETLTEPYIFGAMITDDLVLYGTWYINQYIISYYTDGGTIIEPVTQDYGTEIHPPLNPVKEGHSFIGWYEDADFIQPFEFSTLLYMDTILYAKWDIHSYTLQFETNGGLPMDTLILEYGSSLSSYVPIKEGDSFVAWFMDQQLSTPLNTETMPAHDLYLYAQWFSSYNLELVLVGEFDTNYIVPNGTGDTVSYVTHGGYQMAIHETTYELWYQVRIWAINHGYFFGYVGSEGSNGIHGATPTPGSNQPVSGITWRDIIVWTNAFSEMIGLDPVYRTSSGAIIRDSRLSNASVVDGAIQTERNGLRLPTTPEWLMAARWRNSAGDGAIEIGGRYWTPGSYASGASGDYTNTDATGNVAWYDMNASNETKPVGIKQSNHLGIFDMSGNSYEIVFNRSGSYAVILGGSYISGASSLRIGTSALTTMDPVKGVGFRLARTP